MPQVTFQVKVLTPLFLAGADQSGTEASKAELRAPTFRGLMRYWYRALVGGTTSQPTEKKLIEEVMSAEDAIFGATDVKSSFAVKISNIRGETKEFTERTNVNVNGQWKSTGKGYLLWSMVRSGNPAKGNVKPARWYFPAETKFDLTLMGHSSDEKILQQAIASFWLLTRLGGVGSRSRRCAGSLQATVAATTITLPTGISFDIPANVEGLKKQIADGIHAAQELAQAQVTKHADKPGSVQVQTPKHGDRQGLAPFDSIASKSCRIWIIQNKDRPWTSAEDAMTTIGEDLQDYRGGIKPLQKRRIFGLPLKDVDNKARRSSPLLLHIAELQGRKFVCIAVVFKTAGSNINPDDYKLVEEWATGYPGNIEVVL